MTKNLLILSPSRLRSRLRPGLVLLLLLGSSLIAACGDISVRDNTPRAPQPANPTAVPQSEVGTSDHDLSIMGVDFDPHLDMQRILSREPVAMVVGVMNLGSYRESDVTIKASLWDSGQKLVVARAEKTLDSVAAGDVVPARLVTSDTPPVYSRYKLQVEIVPSNEESNLSNNRRTLDIFVDTAQ